MHTGGKDTSEAVWERSLLYWQYSVHDTNIMWNPGSVTVSGTSKNTPPPKTSLNRTGSSKDPPINPNSGDSNDKTSSQFEFVLMLSCWAMGWFSLSFSWREVILLATRGILRSLLLIEDEWLGNSHCFVISAYLLLNYRFRTEVKYKKIIFVRFIILIIFFLKRWRAKAVADPKGFSFISCNFQQKNCQITGWRPLLWGRRSWKIQYSLLKRYSKCLRKITPFCLVSCFMFHVLLLLTKVTAF